MRAFILCVLITLTIVSLIWKSIPSGKDMYIDRRALETSDHFDEILKDQSID